MLRFPHNFIHSERSKAQYITRTQLSFHDGISGVFIIGFLTCSSYVQDACIHWAARHGAEHRFLHTIPVVSAPAIIPSVCDMQLKFIHDALLFLQCTSRLIPLCMYQRSSCIENCLETDMRCRFAMSSRLSGTRETEHCTP